MACIFLHPVHVIHYIVSRAGHARLSLAASRSGPPPSELAFRTLLELTVFHRRHSNTIWYVVALLFEDIALTL